MDFYWQLEMRIANVSNREYAPAERLEEQATHSLFEGLHRRCYFTALKTPFVTTSPPLVVNEKVPDTADAEAVVIVIVPESAQCPPLTESRSAVTDRSG